MVVINIISPFFDARMATSTSIRFASRGKPSGRSDLDDLDDLAMAVLLRIYYGIIWDHMNYYYGISILGYHRIRQNLGCLFSHNTTLAVKG